MFVIKRAIIISNYLFLKTYYNWRSNQRKIGRNQSGYNTNPFHFVKVEVRKYNIYSEYWNKVESSANSDDSNDLNSLLNKAESTEEIIEELMIAAEESCGDNFDGKRE